MAFAGESQGSTDLTDLADRPISDLLALDRTGLLAELRRYQGEGLLAREHGALESLSNRKLRRLLLALRHRRRHRGAEEPRPLSRVEFLP